MPRMNEKALPSAKLRLAKAERSTIGSRAMKTRAKKATADTAAITANSAMVSSCSQSLRGPSSSTYSSAPRKPAIDSRPHQSKRSSSFKFGLSKSTSARVATVTAMPGSTLMKNSQRQRMRVGEIVADRRADGGPSVAMMPIRGVINECRESEKIVEAVANAVGIMPPPMKPWMARHTMISLIEVDSPHMTLAAVKPAAEIANRARVPSARDRKPDSGIAITSAIR